MAKNSIGLIELGSIAAGYQVTRRHAEGRRRRIGAGALHLLRQVHGDGAGRRRRRCRPAWTAGIKAGSFSVIDTFVIPNVHESIFPAIGGTTKVEALEALGVLESFSVASLIEGADAAVKSADVQLVECAWPWRSAEKPTSH